MDHMDDPEYRVPHGLRSTPAAIMVVAVLYAGIAQAVYCIATLPGHVAPIFPSAGIALAAVLVLGRPALAGVMIGSMLANFIRHVISGPSPVLTLKGLTIMILIGIGAMAGAGAGAMLVRRYCGNQYPLQNVRNILVLVAVGALGCCMISPAVGVLTLSFAGIIPWKFFGHSMLTWWIGDAAGAIIAAPLVLSWLHRDRYEMSPVRTLEAVAVGALLLLLCHAVFFGNIPFEYGLMPLLLWAAFRFGMRGATAASVVIAVIASIGTTHGSGPFARGAVNESLLLLYSFLSVNVFAALFLTSILAERMKAKEDLVQEIRFSDVLLESLPGIFFFYEMNAESPERSRLRRFNRNHAVATGYSPDELRRMTVADWFEGDMRQKAVEAIRRGTKGGVVEVQLDLRMKNGTKIPYFFTGRTLIKGTMPCFLGMGIDVSDYMRIQKALSDSEAFRKRVFESSRVPIVIMDATTQQYIDCNPAAVKIYRYTSREEILGKTPLDVSVPVQYDGTSSPDKARYYIDRALAEGSVVFEWQHQRPTGERWDAEVHLMSFRAGDRHFLQFTLQDITERKQAEEERALFQNLLNRSNDSIEVVDPGTGAFLMVNDRMCSDLGYTREELLSLKVWDIDPTVTLPVFRKNMEELADDRALVWSAFHKRKDGSTFPVEVGLRIVNIGRRYLVAISRDITERKRAEDALAESKRALEMLLSNMPGMAYRCRNDRDWTMEYVSQGATLLTGYPPADFIGNAKITLSEIQHPDDRDRVCDEVQRALERREKFVLQYRITRADKKELWVWEQGQGVFSPKGELLALEGLIMDITDRNRAEEERERLINELALRNAELERFTYTVSHDLKSPLITLRGFLGYLEQDALTGNSERIKADIARITNATDKMEQLLRELLELSRIGRVMNPPEQVGFGEIAREAVGLVAGQLKERGVRVEIATGMPVVFGDHVRLVEVVQNLVDNAAKFMGGQPAPRIEIGAREEERDGKPVLFVKDNGIGIEPRYQEKIFGLFDKLDAKTEGTGIGLAIVKRIVEVHGGTIWIESEGSGQGATFCFTLPRPQAASGNGG